MRKAIYIIMAVMALAVLPATAQKLTYNIEMSAAAADGDYAPFWHTAMRQGVGSVNTKSAYLRAGAAGKYSLSKDWDIAYGLDLIGAKNHTSHIYLQQAYADVTWKMLNISLGQKERWSPLKNHRLTTGGLTESGNARPIPQIRIEFPRYVMLGKWFGLRGHIAYGWFSDENWQKDFAAEGKARTVGVRYHTKAGFAKIGNENEFPLTAEIGLEMAAQFGGTVYNMRDEEGKNLSNPTKLKDYFKIFIPSSGDSEYSGMDQLNIAGNHLGSWHGALTWHDEAFQGKVYYEHAFEDHSQMFWEYGLWTEQLVGVELSLKNTNWVKNVALEYFNLKNHSGPVYHDTTSTIPDQVSCSDNNYNHAWYGGWFNYGQMISTPLVTSPVYNRNGSLKCFNNRVEAFHIGIEGTPLSELGYRLLLTHSNNWGTYSDPFTEIKTNTSGLLELTYMPAKLNGWSASFSFAFDSGDLYGDNIGGMLSIKKCGIIF